MVEPEIKEEKPVDKPKTNRRKDAKNDEPPGSLSLGCQGRPGPGDLFKSRRQPGGSPYGVAVRGSRWAGTPPS